MLLQHFGLCSKLCVGDIQVVEYFIPIGSIAFGIAVLEKFSSSMSPASRYWWNIIFILKKKQGRS